ncbi:lactamase [Abortiporus biennis]|nr:lactamase [Abortiporus biennis]
MNWLPVRGRSIRQLSTRRRWRNTNSFSSHSLRYSLSQMEQLVELPHVTRLSPNVVRVLGQNPGKFTLQGTNTYLIGQRNPYILVDVGEGRDEYIPALEQALTDHATPILPGEVDVSDIILTHRHHDHVNGLPTVLALLNQRWASRNPDRPFPPPRIHKIPAPETDHHLHPVTSSIAPGHHQPTPEGDAIHDIFDGQKFIVSTAEKSTNPSYVHVIHTPGHTPDSLCLFFPDDRALFTADSVLGHGTAVFEDLADYMASLQKLIDFSKDDPESAEHKYATIYPGHGATIKEGPQHVSTYLRHRLDRENQILKVLQSTDPVKDWTTWDIVGTIYKRYPQKLWEPAAHSVDLHLKKLAKEGRVEHLGGEGKEAKWRSSSSEASHLSSL